MANPGPDTRTPHELNTTASSRTRLRIRRLVVAAGAFALIFAGAGVAFAAPPQKLPGNAEALESRWQPAYDYDTDGCYPTPAIGPDGRLNGGLKPTGALHAQCRDASDLANTNGYARYKCNNGWCAIAYVLYFEKDQILENIQSGHRHDLETVVVWVQNDAAQYVSTSAHGNFNIHRRDSVAWLDNTHPKIVYHKEGLGSHCYRLAGFGEAPENHWRTWQQPDLVGWSGMPAGIRDALSNANFGSANFDLKDSRFNSTLAKAKPAGISFDPHA